MSKLLNYIQENYFKSDNPNLDDTSQPITPPSTPEPIQCKVVMSPIIEPMNYADAVAISALDDMHDIDLTDIKNNDSSSETILYKESFINDNSKSILDTILSLTTKKPDTTDAFSQTDTNELENEINILKIKNAKLESNIREISSLLASFTKIDVNNPELDTIRQKLIILLNRELRMHYAFPFSNILSKSV